MVVLKLIEENHRINTGILLDISKPTQKKLDLNKNQRRCMPVTFTEKTVNNLKKTRKARRIKIQDFSRIEG